MEDRLINSVLTPAKLRLFPNVGNEFNATGTNCLNTMCACCRSSIRITQKAEVHSENRLRCSCCVGATSNC